jgi:acetyltransferase
MTDDELWTQLAHYRQVRTLPDGARLLVRPLCEDDKEGLVALFARASKQDLEYFRHDASDATVVESWVDNLNYRRVLPLVAVVDGKLVGDFTLHFRKRYHRHLAWVRLFIDHDYRGRGIGTMMLRSLIDIARRVGLMFLYIEVVSSQYRVIKAVEDLGFQHAVTLQDYFITSDGELLDMAILSLPLADPSGQF